MTLRSTPYPQAFRQQILELVKIGKTPKELSAEFGPCPETIKHWVEQDTCYMGKQLPGKTGPFSHRCAMSHLACFIKRLSRLVY